MVLAGSGEFTPAMDAIDRELLAEMKPGARVAIVPTAAGLEQTPKTWAAMGSDHFSALGAEPVPLMVLNKADANDAQWRDLAATIDWFYFSGGDPGHVVETLAGSPFWSAVLARHADGAVIAGSSAGAMMLGQTTFVPTERGPDGFPTKVGARAALGLVPRAIIAPHFDILPPRMLGMWSRLVPPDHRMLGIDEDTAMLQRNGDWDVRGRGRVLVFRTAEDRAVYPSGADALSLAFEPLP